MKEYPDWVYKVGVPKGLRLVSNEEAMAAISIGATGYGYHLEDSDGPAYLRLGFKNYKDKSSSGPSLWGLKEHHFSGYRSPYLLTFICVDE